MVDAAGAEAVLGGLVALAIVIGLGVYAYTRFYGQTFEFFNPDNDSVVFLVLEILPGGGFRKL